MLSHIFVSIFFPYELSTVAFGSLNTRETKYWWREGVKESTVGLMSSEFLTVNNYIKLSAIWKLTLISLLQLDLIKQSCDKKYKKFTFQDL